MIRYLIDTDISSYFLKSAIRRLIGGCERP